MTIDNMDKIEHVVVLMLENRSFDHILGDLSLSGGRGDVDGLQPGMSNPDPFGGSAPIQAVTTEKFLTDPTHSFEAVKEQLDFDGKQNQGFVMNYARLFPTPAKKKKLAPEIMHYQTSKTVPIYYLLAQEYAISDTWFCSVPSETWPNRIFTSAATTQGRLTNRLHLYDLPTIFSRLRDKNLEWACYNDQIPNMINIRHLAGEWLRSRHEPDSRFRSMKQFEEDCAVGGKGLPQYSFIEPVYFYKGANDDHPPNDIMKGQLLIAQVYLAVRRNPELWKKTMLVITTDEHGGFFDHVQPLMGDFIPAPTLPPGTNPDFDFDFHRLGPRVPLILVTPWASQTSVFRSGEREFFDHTSLIRTAAVKWSLEPLTERDKGAKDFWFALDLPEARTDDQVTFEKVAAFMAAQRPRTLAVAAEVAQQQMVGMDGHAVAARIAADRERRTLAVAAERPSAFEASMQDLAAEVLVQSGALQEEARM
jgi:phospholipase C